MKKFISVWSLIFFLSVGQKGEAAKDSFHEVAAWLQVIPITFTIATAFVAGGMWSASSGVITSLEELVPHSLFSFEKKNHALREGVSGPEWSKYGTVISGFGVVFWFVASYASYKDNRLLYGVSVLGGNVFIIASMIFSGAGFTKVHYLCGGTLTSDFDQDRAGVGAADKCTIVSPESLKSIADAKHVEYQWMAAWITTQLFSVLSMITSWCYICRIGEACHA